MGEKKEFGVGGGLGLGGKEGKRGIKRGGGGEEKEEELGGKRGGKKRGKGIW